MTIAELTAGREHFVRRYPPPHPDDPGRRTCRVVSMMDGRPVKPIQPGARLPRGADEWAPGDTDGWIHYVFDGGDGAGDLLRAEPFGNLAAAIRYARAVVAAPETAQDVAPPETSDQPDGGDAAPQQPAAEAADPPDDEDALDGDLTTRTA